MAILLYFFKLNIKDNQIAKDNLIELKIFEEYQISIDSISSIQNKIVKEIGNISSDIDANFSVILDERKIEKMGKKDFREYMLKKNANLVLLLDKRANLELEYSYLSNKNEILQYLRTLSIDTNVDISDYCQDSTFYYLNDVYENEQIIFKEATESIASNNAIIFPSIEKLLFKNISIENKKIDVRISPKVGKMVGVAICERGDYIIYIDDQLYKKIAPLTFVFLLYHELGHHFFNHAHCKGKYIMKMIDEYKADCFAYNYIFYKFRNEHRDIIMGTYHNFFGLSKRSSGSHPSSIERAENLIELNHCDNFDYKSYLLKNDTIYQ